MYEFFETIRIEEGNVHNLEWHQKRCERTLRHFGSSRELDLASAIKPHSDSGVFRCKLVYTPQKIIDVSYTPYKRRSITSLKLLESDIEYDFKYLDRSEIDALFFKKGEFDEVLIVKNGFITDTSIANVAFFNGSKWFTPKKPLLEGTSRARHIATGRLETLDITPDMLRSFSKVALMNAMIDFDIMSIKEIQKDGIIC